MSSQVKESVWDVLRQTLLSTLECCSLKTAVLAAHPDDETIGASLVLTHTDPTIIYLTDGAPRDTRLWPPDMQCSREEYAATRRREAEHAVACACVSSERMFWLGAVDQEGIFAVARSTATLAGILEQCRPSVLVTLPYEGGHPDHDACALLARLAIEIIAADARPELVEMTSYHARQGSCATGEFLNSDPSSELIIDLNEAQREIKRKMMAAHASQKLVLQYFETKHERYRRAPQYDFTRPPHEGKLWYECMNWKMTSKQWCAIAREAMPETKVLACR
jgi:N-acetylglucosamine malate deacetylase 2